jgi:DNA-binding CsgD family transcriptional regulator/tetratricopeptide (TPR) repeat protein
MRAVFDHSWNLLNDTEREVFKKLSVFRGGFRKEAAQAVAGASLSTLAALVDKSFLRVDGTGRYDLHELLRQYGEEKLRLDADEYHAARDQHSAYHAEFMRQQEPKLKSHQQQIALKEIEAEIDNVRAAWEWALEQRQLEDIDKSCECLRYYFEVRGWYHEGEAFFRHAAERLTPDDASENQNLTFGKVLLGQANCAYRSGYYGKALERLQDCLAIFRQYVSQRETALALAFIIGVMPKNRREQAQLYQECLSICRAVNDPWLTCYVAIQAGQGSAGGDLFVTDFQRDIKIAYDDLVLVKQFGDRWLIMRSLRRTGLIAIRMGAYDEARRLFLEAVAICEYLNSPYMKAQMVHWLGTISQNLGEYDDAKRLYQASLLVGRIAQNYWLLWINTTGLSDIARMQGRYAEAKQLALEAIEYLQVAGEASFLDGKVWALSSLGAAELALKDYLQARQHFAEALQISINVWSIPLTLQSLAFIAELLAAEGNLEPALDLLVITLHHILSRKETQDKTAQCLAQYEAHWSPETITGVREGWRAKEIQVDSLAEILSVSAESVSEWLTGLKPPISPPPSKLQRSSQLFTERELEILRLVAEGHSNREIAQQHVLALSTVKWYVKQLYNKLGVNNRTQAAARARELHLL